MTVVCGVHGWMKAYIRVFYHPYAAATSVGADLEKKQYEDKTLGEVRNVPRSPACRSGGQGENRRLARGPPPWIFSKAKQGRELTIKKENVVDFEGEEVTDSD